MRALAGAWRAAAPRIPGLLRRAERRPFSVSSVMCEAQGGSMRPLDGVRVLDMTRVLAGVCFCPVRAALAPDRKGRVGRCETDGTLVADVAF